MQKASRRKSKNGQRDNSSITKRSLLDHTSLLADVVSDYRGNNSLLFNEIQDDRQYRFGVKTMPDILRPPQGKVLTKRAEKHNIGLFNALSDSFADYAIIKRVECARRKVRKEVLHALGINEVNALRRGKGKGARDYTRDRPRNWKSKIKC